MVILREIINPINSDLTLYALICSLIGIFFHCSIIILITAYYILVFYLKVANVPVRNVSMINFYSDTCNLYLLLHVSYLISSYLQ